MTNNAATSDLSMDTKNLSVAKYIVEFDAVRAIAVLMVMFAHYFGQFTVSGSIGFSGVTIFFVLSGYLITQILLHEKSRLSSTISETNKVSIGFVLKTFYIRRSLRIFPIYYLVLIILFILNFESARQYFLYHFFYASNFLYSFHIGFDHLSHFWSLAVEEQFYIVWPLLILSIPANWVRPSFFLTLIVSSILFKYCMAQIYSYDSLAIDFMMPSCIEAFSFGALAVLLKDKIFKPGVLSGLLIISLVFYIFLRWFLYSDPGGKLFQVSSIINRSFLSLSTACLLLCIVKKQMPLFVLSILNNPVLIFIGKISYGIYVYHMFTPVFLQYIQDTFHFSLAGTGIFMPLNFIISFLVAYLSFKLIEQPIMRLKHKFKYL